MNYIAYTIGPIYDTIFDTLNGDNKTKKLKAGSYFFSLFMKTLLFNIKNEFDILVPYIGSDALTKDYNMGLFHDRFIATCKDLSKEEVKNIFEQKVNDTYKVLSKEILDESIAYDLMNNMDNHSIVANADELKNIDENIIFALNNILDSKELQKDFGFDIKTNYIQKYQEQQIKKLDKVKNLVTLSKGFNYYAVITADGDKMGQKIKNEATDDITKIKEISKNLFDFFTAEDDIYKITNNHFDGELIYAGGDDILAFLPIKNGDKTFLDYIEVLDTRFKTIIGDDVSLSFGVNIVYKKYPLRDAINKSFDLLYEAKNNGQNSIAIATIKHSGQTFNSTQKLNTSSYTKYKDLIDGILKDKISLPHSIHHNLKRYEETIIGSFTNEHSSIDAMFKTVFNDIKNDKDTKGIETLKLYISTLKPKTNKEFDDIFSHLSLIKFLREDRK